MSTTLKNKSASDIYDVVISGAGPVGLFLACELALAKCSVLVLEKAIEMQSPLKRLPFGIRGLSSPTIEALCRRHLLQELEIHKHLKNPHQNAVQGPRRQAGHFAGIPFHDGDIDSKQWKYRLPSSTPASLITEMQELETALSRRAEFLGTEIKRGFAVTGFHQNNEGVIVQAGEQSFACKWLVGCDGSRSVVRKMGGFEFAGTEPEFTGYSAKADILNPEVLKPGRNVTPRGMYMQSQPGYLAIQDFDGGAFHGSAKPVTREHLQEVLRRVSNTDVTISTLHIASTWTDRARQATNYRNRRILLAGDAAHIHAPLGGQGLNLGLGDAMNLGWKLAATIRGKAPEGLLDSYGTERHPIGVQVLDWSRAQAAIMKPEPNARALHAIITDLINTTDGATYFAGRVWGVLTKIDLTGKHPLVGRSVPEFEFEEGTKISDLMHNGQGILLDFDDHIPLKKLAEEYSGQIDYISATAKDNLGLCAVLVRPDGIVAWATDNVLEISELQKAMERWFVNQHVD
ncbi:2-polyprenyl-6-methoxyphenol hydroxylase-like FAD-dependent oxidoreductase [Pedobacter sp. AK013]|uniref:FAD-dependent monooxygenase n=1 Tax=Pedobacter sp. AK013 TaxID=2723071 RepID=UPI00160A60DA|nr:FAD-dependent monooxygenase [Pedobacter sp. AK013]MBB6236871.1 2-polyprenyl-6-methoxyphenol hydroxylase-like FAD-dependent oxidoreductase [Pedobacter sp. AK013]